MKTLSLFHLIIALFWPLSCRSGNNPEFFKSLYSARYPDRSLSALPLCPPNNRIRFIENKGQMLDMKMRKVPFVLFKAETPGVDLYITENGLTYVFYKQNNTTVEASDNEEKEAKVNWERVDVTLSGGSIKKQNLLTERRG